MSTSLEDLKARMTANDVEIAELKKDIKGLEKKPDKIEDGWENLKAWRSCSPAITLSSSTSWAQLRQPSPNPVSIFLSLPFLFRVVDNVVLHSALLITSGYPECNSPDSSFATRKQTAQSSVTGSIW